MSSQIVLVTGVNGYIGSHIGLQLLQRGYTVRGASRSASGKAQLLKEAFKGFEDQYEHYVVPDMTVSGAFDEAAKGVHAVIHVASPIDFSLTNIEAFFGPAAGGVITALESAKKAGPQLKSFVVTSSIAAILDSIDNPPNHVYTSSDWNTSSETKARNEFHPAFAYGASKTIAEKTFWEWRDKNQPSFALAAVNPGLVMGPPITWPDTPRKLNASLQAIWNVYSGTQELPTAIGSGTAVDVRDVARFHIWCMEHPLEANGQRYIAVTGRLPPQAVADIFRKHYPKREFAIGTPGAGYIPGTFGWGPGEGGFIADEMFTALGGREKVINLDRMVLDTAEAFEKRWPGVAKSSS